MKAVLRGRQRRVVARRETAAASIHHNLERKHCMSNGTLVAGPLPKIGRTELAQIPVPEATSTHRPVPHHETVEALVETLSFRGP